MDKGQHIKLIKDELRDRRLRRALSEQERLKRLSTQQLEEKLKSLESDPSPKPKEES
jgi:hypothetical protein